MTEAALREQKPEATGGAAPSPRWEEDALGFLIAPIGKAEFLESYYERKPLINIRNAPERYADLLTLDMLDHFINSADLREGMIDLTNHKNRIERDEYVNEDGRISRATVAEEYLRGSTIILPQFHDSMFNLGEFCRALEEVLTCHMQTNIYLTPQPEAEGDGNQGFPPHYDNHDVFVMQISGSKAWRIYGTAVETPFRGEQFELGRHEAGEVTQSITLNAGDCLYLPRGIMHDAENVGAEPSLHITVGLITKTWADLLLESISELALSSPDFRRSLPAGFANRDFDREKARGHFDKLVRQIADGAGMDSAFDLLADNFIRGRRPNVSGVISGSAATGAQDRYRRRRFVPWNVADDEGKLILIGPGGDLEFDDEAGDALDVALSGAPFTAADLPNKDPAELIRILWAAGYLERLDA
jgi:ribosomal protein L16 Arg81 hydroxylase